MVHLNPFLLTTLLSAGLATAVHAQSIEGRALILSCDSSYTSLKVDMLEAGDTTTFIQEMRLNAQTIVVDRRNDPIPASALQPGTEVEITGARVNYVYTLSKVKVRTLREEADLRVEGLVEAYFPADQSAMVNGERIKLVPEGRITTHYDLPQPYKGLSEIPLGYRAEVRGTKRAGGYLLVDRVEVRENILTADDRAALTELTGYFKTDGVGYVQLPPGAPSLYKGTVPTGVATFGDYRVRIADDLDLQSYANYVGNSVVPQWMKDLPDVPEKLNFRFIVVDNPTFNAYATPNGLVMVHTGLLEQVDNEAQLAALLGHEVAHAVNRHATERYVEQKKMRERIDNVRRTREAVSRVPIRVDVNLPGPNVNINWNWVEHNFDILLLMAYDFSEGDTRNLIDQMSGLVGDNNPIERLDTLTRDAFLGALYSLNGLASGNHKPGEEVQSDQVGLWYMAQAGYDPREAAKVWEKFTTLTKPAGVGNVVDRIDKVTMDWMITSNSYTYPNPLNQLGDMLTSWLIRSAQNNWFSSHPKAAKRYRTLNELVNVYYAPRGFADVIVGTDEYAPIKAKAAARNAALTARP